MYDTFDRRVSTTVTDYITNGSGVAVAGTPVVESYAYDEGAQSRGDVILDFVDSDGSGGNAAAVSKRYLWGQAVDQLFAQEDVAKTLTASDRYLWLLQDKLGTVRDVLNRSGGIVARVEYNAFGVIQSVTNAAGQSIAVPTRWLYTCQEYDPITGNIWFSNGAGRGRWYSPTLNRFLQPDDLGFAAGDMNLYRPVGNSPTNASDPSGQDTVRIEGDEVIWVIERPDNRSLGQKIWDGMVGNVFEPVRKVVIGRIQSSSCGESLMDEFRGEVDPGGVNRGGHLRTVRVSEKWGGKDVLLLELQQAARLSENDLAELTKEEQDAAIQQYLANVREGKYHSKNPAKDRAAGLLGRPDLADNPNSSAYHRGEVLREAGERAQQVAGAMRGGGGVGSCPGAKAKKGGAKDSPNPHGSKGKPDHQKKVDELEDRAAREAAEGERVVREKKIQGHDSNRRPDVQIQNEEGNTRKVFEAERHPSHQRNQRREAEYDDLGLPNETHPLD